MATQMFKGKPSSRGYATVDISTAANGQSAAAVNITGLTLCSIQMSTGWDTANLGFQGNVDGSTSFFDLHDSSGNFLTFTTSANFMVGFDPAQFAGVQLLKLVSETSAGVAVAQSVTRTIKLGLAEYVAAD